MRVRLRLDGDAPRLWHRRLFERLRDLPGLAVEVDLTPGPGRLPGRAETLFALDATLGGAPARDLSARASLSGAAPSSGRTADLVIDLCGDVPEADGTRVWRLTFDGRPGEAALLGAILARRAPVAALLERGRIVASGRLGSEAVGAVVTPFEDALARAITLILAAVQDRAPILAGADAVPEGGDPAAALTATALAARAARMAVRSVVRRAYHLGYRAPHWRVGWRRLSGPDMIDLRVHPSEGWRDLPDDGRRFYADPFPISHAGRTILFVEDYEHARGRAVISAVAFGPDGPLGAPVPVLTEPYHLSYPFVFARDGDHWMIPESGANGTVDLYRATDFPAGWVKVATLVSGIVASDATLLEQDGRWWMFATVREPQDAGPAALGSYSDALHLFCAPDFRGPWTPHAMNPVLVDIASARPAGRIVARDGALFRPVQDGRRGYGAELAIARIDRLDAQGYAQTVETILTAGPLWPGTRLHTLNRAGDFEFIDGSARAPRLPWRRRARSRSGRV